MRKGLIKQDECYTPKWFLKYFGDFDYDPATNKKHSEYLNIKNYDTIDSDGLKSEWNYNKIWINPPFTKKFIFLEKAVETYKKYHNDIYILFPIESMTTRRWFEIIGDTKFKIYIPNFRLGFIVDDVEYTHGAFGIVVLKLQDNYDIELIEKERMIL